MTVRALGKCILVYDFYFFEIIPVNLPFLVGTFMILVSYSFVKWNVTM